MKIEHKLTMLLAMQQLSIEYIEDIESNHKMSAMFMQEFKRDSKRLLRTAEKHINRVCSDKDTQVSEQLHAAYVALSNLIEKGIQWPEEAKTQS